MLLCWWIAHIHIDRARNQNISARFQLMRIVLMLTLYLPGGFGAIVVYAWFTAAKYNELIPYLSSVSLDELVMAVGRGPPSFFPCS